MAGRAIKRSTLFLRQSWLAWLNLISANINAKRLKLCYTNRIYDTGQTKDEEVEADSGRKRPPKAFCGMNLTDK